MGTLLVGLLVIAAGAVGFGLALFGRRPIPQPATATSGAQLAPGPPRRARRSVPALDALRRRLDESDEALAPTGWVRARAALLLTVTIVGLAALIGGALSILVVGAVLLLT